MYMSDPTILPRVREYLEANSNEIYVDINALADELQSKYKEYSKRKRSAFRASVNKAYSILLRRCNLEKINGHVISEILSPKLPEPVADTSYDVQNPDNVMNRSLTELYTSSPLKKPSGNELIDISSDDSDNVTTTKSKNEKMRTGKYSQRVTGYGQEDVGKKRKYEQQTVGTETGKKKRGSSRVAEKVTCNLKSLGGMDKTLEEVCKIILHMRHPEVYKNIGVTPPRGLLLHGPPGCGKTLLAKSIAGELDIPLLKVTAPELVAGVSGESEERIRQLFEQAVQSAPCVLFIDEIDAITPSRQNAQKEMERRIVAQLLSCLDELNENGHAVLVIGASNRLDSIDAALRRAGRFDREISIGIPDVHARVEILKTLANGLRLDEGFDFEVLASLTPGYVAADLLSLTREAAMVAINRSFRLVEDQNKLRGAVNGCENVDSTTTQQLDGSINTSVTIPESEKAVRTTLEEVLSWLHNDMAFPDEFLQNLRISMADFQSALKHVQPSAKREGFATIPDITWNDIGSLRDIREELQMAIVAPVRHAKEFYALGINVPTGVLLCGPPGCGKTLLAKAIANEAGINFISVKGPELLNMYVGESERAVRVCFERARNSAPCVIFFDELDALCPKRSESTEGSSSRVVNQMLTEMDGVEGRTGVFLLAASNRPDIIDPAVLRPGRLDKILFVDLPSALDRADILKAITKNGTVPPLAGDVSLEDIAKSEQCKGFTGADLAALIREASVIALKAFMTGSNVGERITVKSEHFLEAFSKIRPSVSDKDMRHYEKLRKLYSISKFAEEMECS